MILGPSDRCQVESTYVLRPNKVGHTTTNKAASEKLSADYVVVVTSVQSSLMCKKEHIEEI